MRPIAKLAAVGYLISAGHTYGYLVGYGSDPILSIGLAAVFGPLQILGLTANAAGRRWTSCKPSTPPSF
jgi:hypothetical protein